MSSKQALEDRNKELVEKKAEAERLNKCLTDNSKFHTEQIDNLGKEVNRLIKENEGNFL